MNFTCTFQNSVMTRPKYFCYLCLEYETSLMTLHHLSHCNCGIQYTLW